MSATDELRRLLDERGVEWQDFQHENHTWWFDSGGFDSGDACWHAENRPTPSGMLVKIDATVTPERAIAATLETLVTGDTSDGFHTFNELYHHRAVLFSVIVGDHKELAWKSKLHHDGTMYDGMFIVGIETPKGQATYHYDIDPYWDMFNCKELDQAPEWDGHTPSEAIERIATLGSCNCSNNCTNSERTETCHVAETDRYRVRTEGTGCPLTVRIMKCSKCGGTYGYVTGGYEYCPRCGRKVVDPTTNDVNTEVDDG